MNDSIRYRGRIFRIGGSQAVRLPKECRFPEDADEVIVRREGSRVIIEPADMWSKEALACIGMLDVELERVEQTPVTKLTNPLESS